MQQALALAVGNSVQCTQNLKVRSTYSTTANEVTTETSGAIGTISGGPQTGSGYTWWYIDWKNGFSGWSVQDYLQAITTYTLNISSSNPSSGAYIYVGPNDNQGVADGTTSFSRQYNSGTSVTLIAPTSAGGNSFSKWALNGSDYSASRTVTFTLTGNSTMTAIFVAAPPVTHTVTVASSNPASGVNIGSSTLDNNTNAGGTTSFTRIFNHNATATYVAPATASGNNFQKWQRDGVDFTTSTTASLTMDADHTLTAVYSPPVITTYSLNVASSNPSSGAYIYVGPNDKQGLADGTTSFSRQYNSGTSVTLIAPTSAGGNSFSKWTLNGSDYSVNRTVTFTLSGNSTMTAIYVAAPPVIHTVTVASSNPASGVNISSSTLDNNTNAGGTTTFTRIFNHNAMATYVAPATAGGNSFKKWQRDGVDFTTSTTASVTMDADHTLTAIYGASTLALAVTSPNGGESWAAGSTHSVTWTASNTSGIAYFKVALSTDGGVTWPSAGTANDLTPAGIYNPSATIFSWTISNSLNSSALRIRVRALDSTGNILAEDAGNSNFTVAAAAMPDLVIEPGSITFAPTTVVSGGSVAMSFRVRNSGQGSAVATKARLRLSTDTTLTRDDSPLSPLDVNIPALSAGGVYAFQQTMQVPSTTPQGQYYVGIFADIDDVSGQSNLSNDSGISSAKLGVSAGGVSPPVITSQPVGKQVNVGGEATFKVQAQGTNLQYRWMRFGNFVGNETASLILTNVSASQAGEYWVQVSNAGGVVQSNHVALAVDSEPPLPTTPPKSGVCTVYGDFSPNLPTIIITHGWQRTGNPGDPVLWMNDTRSAIQARLNKLGKSANILLFTWPEAYSVDPWRPFLSVHSEGQELAKFLRPLIAAPYSQPVQFIGHSFGSFVNAYAVEALGTQIDQFTILDAPIGIIPKQYLADVRLGSFFARHLGRNRVDWVDNYIAEIPTSPFSLPFGDFIDGAAPNKGLGTKTSHETIQSNYYTKTVVGTGSGFNTGGFNDSVIISTGGRPDPVSWIPPVSFVEILADVPEAVRYAAGEIQKSTDKVGDKVQNIFKLIKGVVSPISQPHGRNLAAVSALQDATLEFDLTVPEKAQQMTFDFLFAQLGDGDWLTVSFNDTLLYNFLGKSFYGADYHQAEVPIANFSGKTGVLTVTLHSANNTVSEVRVSNFKFLSQSASLAGSLKVSISPVKAVSEGARWRVDGGSWHKSEATLSGLTTGKHTISFSSVSGWSKPVSKVVTIVADETTTETVAYANPDSKVNVSAFLRSGWSDKVVVTRWEGDRSDSGSLTASDNLYLSYTIANGGTLAVSKKFVTDLFIDGVLKWSHAETSMATNTMFSIIDFEIGSLSPGKHQIRIKTDSKNSLIENNENDNEYVKTIVVSNQKSPEIEITDPDGVRLVDGATGRHLGSKVVGEKSKMNFRIKNIGSSYLNGLKVTRSGYAGFSVGKPLAKTSLAPGASETLQIQFKPSSKGDKKAVIHISSNDANESPFEIKVFGTGVSASAHSTLAYNGSSAAGADGFRMAFLKSAAEFGTGEKSVESRQRVYTEVIDGKKYLAITVQKSWGGISNSFRAEVSSDLLEWYSGENYTTVLRDNYMVYEARDNTPMIQGKKRSIRIVTDPPK